ncbi:hypothetical protein BCF44_107295 [Kutzneria buriramensis]|uniref:Uncharacterized protein n=2 Tax=Kutzneria buriramensis TaxID=1045776 RepID=A0A3E0HIE4_9PSEU|nr:hypothetical protein BCF44_107295 [Kutzneria buriramensis]
MKAFRRWVAAAGLAGLLSGVTLVASAQAASASTIQQGWIQLCSQGGYDSYLEFPAWHSATTIVPQKQCDWWPVNTGGATILVVAHDDKGTSLGSYWYNSSGEGLGIGTESDVKTGWRYAINW